MTKELKSFFKKLEKDNPYDYFLLKKLYYNPNSILSDSKEYVEAGFYYDEDSAYNYMFNNNLLEFLDLAYDLCCDVYIIEFNHMIGFTIIRGKEKETNIVEVSTLPNTKNILTMVPSSKNFAINIKTYDKEEEVKTKEFKRESQIDKFNRKYGMK